MKSKKKRMPNKKAARQMSDGFRIDNYSYE